MQERRWAAAGLVVGPVAFITAWAAGGRRMPDYSPVHDAISRLAAVHSPQRTLMTVGFLVYAGAVGVGSTAVRRTPLARCWPALAVNAASTAAVAALPLDHSGTVDGLHAIAAAVGYASISLAPLLAARPLAEEGHRRAARASVAVGVTAAACLAATVVTDASGFFQRAGLTAGDAWLVALGLTLLLSSSHDRAGLRAAAFAEGERARAARATKEPESGEQ